MIFVTVGTQLGFNRLIAAMDNLASILQMPIIAQTGPGDYIPKNIEWRSNFSPDEFESLISTSSIIVSHAGIGTILNAAKHRKPIVLLPRKAELHEHRNDHQLSTSRLMADRPGVFVAEEESDLLIRIREGLSADPVAMEKFAIRDHIVREVRRFLIDSTALPPENWTIRG